jgi:hypothetical protein
VTDKRVSTYLSSNMGLCISSTRLDGLRIPAVPRPVAVVLGGGGGGYDTSGINNLTSGRARQHLGSLAVDRDCRLMWRALHPSNFHPRQLPPTTTSLLQSNHPDLVTPQFCYNLFITAPPALQGIFPWIIMASRTVSTLKFVGSISLGLLTV